MSDTGDRLAQRLAVYLVADPEQTRRALLEDVSAALCGGATTVQLRTKHLSDRETVQVALAIRALTSDAGVLFLVNDRLDIALASGADGVHLGVDDLPLSLARHIAPAGFILGYSPETDEQAASAREDGADYLGVGPIFSTSSKSDAGDPIGLETLSRRVALAGVPVIGIGGISSCNASLVIEAGAVGVAVVSAILSGDDPKTATERLVEAVNSELAQD
jgi:thiamine-phosphate pyrophosphorylase